ncbi:MAG: NUDIX domain-containing protein [Planctomycetes bacterium]|nr:NUDIX domain-containing protein [Planctomycetota bacterium]
MSTDSDPDAKLRSLDDLVRERETWRREGKTVVWTNGCFDLFHAGHARALAGAKSLGDVLVVGLNSDASVRRLKGGGRPLIGERDRAAMLGALAAVDRVVIFQNDRCDRELAALAPDIWTKSGDYTPDSLDPVERAAVEAGGGRIVITPLVPGLSTTLLVKKIQRHDPEKIVSAACTLILNRRRELLMVATQYADTVKWGLPGGGQTHGESLRETARRETYEETGLDVVIGDHLGVIERIEPDLGLHLVLHLFRGTAAAADEERTDFSSRPEPAIREVAWFSEERMRSQPGIIMGRRLWLDSGYAPEGWPRCILMRPGEE